jgi:hypothetical protein
LFSGAGEGSFISFTPLKIFSILCQKQATDDIIPSNEMLKAGSGLLVSAETGVIHIDKSTANIRTKEIAFFNYHTSISPDW